jgi:hypothetical protein
VKGFASIHPRTQERLEHLGVKDWHVTQGVGYAAASAGTHKPVGKCAGRAFGHCVDLDYKLADRTFFDEAAAAAILVFCRDGAAWRGNEHLHCVDISALLDDNGSVPDMRELVQVQAWDWIAGRTGLVGHARERAAWRRTDGQAEFARGVLERDERARVAEVRLLRPGRRALAVDCVAFLVGAETRCELRPMAEALGGQVVWRAGSASVLIAGALVDLGAARVRLEGQFSRCGLRALCEAMGAAVEAEWVAGRLVVEVHATQ